MKNKDVIDEDGNVIAPPEPASDLGQLVYLLQWARQHNFRVGPAVQIGGLIVQVRDLKQEKANTRNAPDDGDIFEEHGHKER